MRKLTQREFLSEGISDVFKGLKAAIVAGAETFAPEIVNPLRKVAEPFKKTKNAFFSQQPLSVLKDTLAKKTDIEFIEMVGKPDQRLANPKKNKFQSKNVTLITFTAYVYKKGTERQYKPYGEAVSNTLSPLKTGPERLNTRSRFTPPNTSVATTAAPTNEPKDVMTLTAEVFRTKDGLIVSEIYDTKTGVVFYSASGNQGRLPIFDSLIRKYIDNSTGGYPVKNLVAFLKREIKLTDTDANGIITGARNLQELISKSTGARIANINTLIPDNKIYKLKQALMPLYVESNKNSKSQRILLSEMNSLVN
jgi:hypothetical protein